MILSRHLSVYGLFFGMCFQGGCKQRPESLLNEGWIGPTSVAVAQAKQAIQRPSGHSYRTLGDIAHRSEDGSGDTENQVEDLGARV